LELVPIDPPGRHRPCVLSPVTDSKRKREGNTEVLNPGQLIYFKITNNSDSPLYLYLFDISPDGSINWVYPNPKHNIDIQLNPKKSIETLLPNNCPMIGLYEIGETNAPFGTATYKLIASKSKINGRLLQSPEIARGSRSASASVEEILKKASTNKSKAVSGSSPEQRAWGTISLDIDIRPVNN
jgi:hypothetical protein